MSFVTSHARAVYCSPSCSQRAKRAVDRELVNAEIDALTGTRRGQCTVIGHTDPDPTYNRARILLRCDCGTEFPAIYAAWKRGNPVMCLQCSRRRVMKPYRDRVGEQVGALTILGMDGEWNGEYLTRYRVRCAQCGGESIMDGGHLRTNRECAACARKNLETGRQMFREADVEGTNLYMLRGAVDGTRAVNKNSSSGITGVNRFGDKWRAVIVFKRKQYTLGIYDTVEQAAKRRREGEEHLYKDFLEWYEAEQKRRQEDAMPETERILHLWAQKPKVHAISVRTGIPTPRVRRILIDNGIYPTARAREVKELTDAGLTPEEIAGRLEITVRAVEAYLPYQRGTYSGESSTTAWRRAKEKEK